MSWRRERLPAAEGLLVFSVLLDSESLVFIEKPQRFLGELSRSKRVRPMNRIFNAGRMLVNYLTV
jgi:hypothetical protein